MSLAHDGNLAGILRMAGEVDDEGQDEEKSAKAPELA